MFISRSAAVLIFFALASCSSKDAAPDAGTGDSGAVAVMPSGSSSSAEPTANDISNYKLDMDKMRKYAAAMKGFQTLGASDSMVLEAMASSDGNETTAQTIARIETSPIAIKVLQDAGLTAKDYVWITAAWLQAAMTAGMLESTPGAKLPEGQNPQNVEFMKQHKAELEAMSKDMGMKGN